LDKYKLTKNYNSLLSLSLLQSKVIHKKIPEMEVVPFLK